MHTKIRARKIFRKIKHLRGWLGHGRVWIFFFNGINSSEWNATNLWWKAYTFARYLLLQLCFHSHACNGLKWLNGIFRIGFNARYTAHGHFHQVCVPSFHSLASINKSIRIKLCYPALHFNVYIKRHKESISTRQWSMNHDELFNFHFLDRWKQTIYLLCYTHRVLVPNVTK